MFELKKFVFNMVFFVYMSPNICLIKFDLLLLIGPPGSLSTVSYWMVT